MAELTNRHFHSWVVRELIGAGGVAEVFRVEHADDPGALAALKVLRPERVAERRHAQSLEREHAILAGLDHAGIPKVRRLGEIAGRPALLLDYIPGRTLAQLEAGHEAFARARALLALVGIVAYLHQRGIVHNDLKPENAMLAPEGRLTLIDFGNAREAQGTSLFRRFFRRPTTFFATAAYVAPELIAGHQPTCASDLYALGMCAFAILTGALPFAATVGAARLSAHQRETAPSIRERLPQLGPRMAKVIDACLDKRPQARPDAAALVAALAGLDALIPPELRSQRFALGTSKRPRSQR